MSPCIEEPQTVLLRRQGTGMRLSPPELGDSSSTNSNYPRLTLASGCYCLKSVRELRTECLRQGAGFQPLNYDESCREVLNLPLKHIHLLDDYIDPERGSCLSTVELPAPSKPFVSDYMTETLVNLRPRNWLNHRFKLLQSRRLLVPPPFS